MNASTSPTPFTLELQLDLESAQEPDAAGIILSRGSHHTYLTSPHVLCTADGRWILCFLTPEIPKL